METLAESVKIAGFSGSQSASISASATEDFRYNFVACRPSSATGSSTPKELQEVTPDVIKATGQGRQHPSHDGLASSRFPPFPALESAITKELEQINEIIAKNDAIDDEMKKMVTAEHERAAKFEG